MSKSSSDDGASPTWRRPPFGWAATTVAASLAVALALGTVYAARPGIVDSIESRLLDRIAAARPMASPSGRVVVVVVDDVSLAAYGRWPWPRYRLARLLQTIADAQPEVVALTFVMAEPDQTSLATVFDNLQREYGSPAAVAGPGTAFVDNDAVLARVLATGPFVVGDMFGTEGNATGEPCPDRVAPTVLSRPVDGTAALPAPVATRGVCTLPALATAAKTSGFLNGRVDQDGRLRRLPLVMRHGAILYPSLALACVMRALDARQIGVDTTGLQPTLTVGTRVIPVDRDGQALIRFAAQPGAIPRVSAADVLAGRVTPDRFRERVVLVGVDAAGISAPYTVTTAEPLSPTDVHAQLVDNVLSGDHVRRPAAAPVMEFGLTIVLAAAAGLAVPHLAFVGAALGSALVAAALWGGALALARTTGLLVSPLLPGAVFLVVVPSLLLAAYWRRQADARQATTHALVRLQHQERELTAILTTIPDIVFRLDPGGRITFISPAVLQYRATPDSLVGLRMLDLVAPDDRQKALYRVNERRAGERATRDLEVRLRLPPADAGDPEAERYFSVSAEGVYTSDVQGGKIFVGTQGIARNVDQRRRLEQELVRARQLEGMGTLAAGVAHDLNNILGALVGYPDLLLLDLPPDSPMREGLVGIRESARRAAAVVQDMLAIARRGVRHEKVTNINALVTAYLASPEWRRLQESHPNVECETSLDPAAMPVLGSSVQLSKVLMNLVNNSAEAMPTGGRVRVSTRNTYVDVELQGFERIPEGEYVALSVADEGVGIAAEHLARVFEPYYSRKALGHSGSGLGMAVVWSTVKGHGGYVDLRSREGEGTQFDLYLPVTRRAPDEAGTAVVLQDLLGTERILVVDDVAEQLTIAARMLGKLGYRVTTVSSGEQAVSALAAAPVDLLVLDMVMPGGIDGLETLRRVRAMRPTQRAIIASGYADAERVAAAQALGAGAYVRKPYTMEAIGLAVRHELDRPQHDPGPSSAPDTAPS